MSHTESLPVRLALLLASALLIGPAFAQKAKPIQNPDPRVQSYLAEHAGEIARLRTAAEDGAVDVEARRRALQQLSLVSEDDVLSVAAGLVTDPSPQISEDAVRLLSNSVVMAGHGTSDDDAAHHDSASPWSSYVNAQHKQARDALNVAASRNPSSNSGLMALKSLVQLSEDGSIDQVRKAAASGAISQAQAVRLCGQSQSNDGRACLIDFLDNGSLEGRVAAIGVLGSKPSDRAMVRNKIFLNNRAEPALRVAAAQVLSSYDPSFSTYGLAVTSDPQTPPDLFAATLESYAASAQAIGKLDSAQWLFIKKALDNKLEAVMGDKSKGADPQPLEALKEAFKTRPHT